MAGVLVAFALAATAATGLSPAGSSSAATTVAAPTTTSDSLDFGSVATARHVPAGFKRTFKDGFVEANGIRQHVVIGGDGPPLLLVHGWPENWYAWRYVMPELAEKFTVIAVDQRGIGLSEKATTGYDSTTLAQDLAALMTELGHERFAVVGHDTGLVISYALAHDFPSRVARVAVAEVPGPPTKTGSPPAFIDDYHNDRLWHISFNRVDDPLILDMISSNANAYFRYEYKIQGGGKTPTASATGYYIRLYTRNRATLTAGLAFYRAWDTTTDQNAVRKKAGKLTMPVLGIGGETSWGGAVGGAMHAFADDVETVVLTSTGHWVAENAPDQLLASLSSFLEPYRVAP
jgi:pimeloyl-ACP methyl ester carboxylesterase